MSGRRSAALEKALKLYKTGDDVYEVAARAGVSASTLYRALKSKATIWRACGHPRTPQNTVKHHGNSPKCLTCKRDKALAYYHRIKNGIVIKQDY